MTVETSKGKFGQLGSPFLPEKKPRFDEDVSCATPWTMNGEGAFELASKSYRSEGQVVIPCEGFESVVFDVDGLLVNSEPLILLAILETAESLVADAHKREFASHADKIKSHCFGRSDEEMSRELYKYLGAELPDLNSDNLLQDEIKEMGEDKFIPFFARAREKMIIGLCKEGVARPMAGAESFVEACYKKFGELALNTGSPENLSKPMLEAAFSDSEIDIETVFPPVRRTYVSDLSRGKPEPDGYIRAAGRLGLRRKNRNDPYRERLMAVVDRGNDAISALRAGYGRIIVVPENMDITQMGPNGTKEKYSVSKYLASLDISEDEKQQLAQRIIIVSSLAQLVLGD
jgi:beta-phosphoglucomutase-like phosphatase (HAD superfamily)